jgi:universal stress protein E
MDRLSNILVIVDPTAKRSAAIEKAGVLASTCGARVELFACETKESRARRYASYLASDGSVDFVTDIRSMLDSLAKPLRDAGVDVRVESTMGDPLYVQFLERAQRTYADLVVKDTHHHSLARRTFLTNTDWHLIRGCPVPLLLTKTRPWSAKRVIAAAVDPGHAHGKPAVLDSLILDWAEALRDKLAGSLHAVHAFMPHVRWAEAAIGETAMMSAITSQMIEDERLRRLARVQALSAPCGINLSNTHVAFGVASEVLSRFAQEEHVDLLVMGAISRYGVDRLFIGSTAERVLEQLPCDVLVVKPRDFASRLPLWPTNGLSDFTTRAGI